MYDQKNVKKSEAEIITIGCENQLQKRNVLKGLALQKLVCSSIMGTTLQTPDIENHSIKRIFEKLFCKQREYFVIEKPFKTQAKLFFNKWQFVALSDFSNYLEIYVRKQVIIEKLKVCDFCGQKIKAINQFSKKCWKCRKGWFHSKQMKKDNWILLIKGAKARVIDFLFENKYLSTLQLRKRLDFFHYSSEVFSIYEAKNKEETGLSFRDLRKTIAYPFIISRCGFPVKKLVIVYNGKLTEELQYELKRGYGENFNFKIELITIKEFLSQKAFTTKGIRVIKTKDHYDYDIIPGATKNIVIDLTLVE